MEQREVKPWDLLNPQRPKASEEVRQARLTICEACPLYRNALSQCSECGCIMPLKTKLADASCPVGKWSSELVG